VRITKAVVPAAGLGTRLYPVTKSQPKEMLPLGTKPTIQRVVEEIVSAGITDILIVTGEGKRAVEDHLDPANGLAGGDTDSPEQHSVIEEAGVRFFYTRQSRPRGLGDAVLHGRQVVGDEHFLVALGDSVIIGREEGALAGRLMDTHLRFSADAVICVQRVSDEATRRYGIVQAAGELAPGVLELSDIVEKPGPEAAPSRLAVTARYTFSPVIFDYLANLEPGHGGEIQLTDAIRAMIIAGRRVLAVPLAEDERRLDVGDFESYSRAFFRMMMTHPTYGASLRSYARSLLSYLEDDAVPDPDLPLAGDATAPTATKEGTVCET